MRGSRYARAKRYCEYTINWLFFELPRGLDFSMRAKGSRITTSGSTGYALTSRRALRNLLDGIEITRDDAFLDIGCGKGGVCCFAAEYEFGDIAGIDTEQWLIDRATKNIDALGLTDRVKVERADATTYNNYSLFNFFFLFNPFDSETYDRVVERIASQVQAASRPIWIICYGDFSDQAITASGLFQLVRTDICPYRGNDIHIWRSAVGVPDSRSAI